ncbi:Cation-transporting_ATPase [Hexamita inflata]|uniref:Cation-transporting ATPase n=2 Tax=Hexamita inflata TaxID=28002 RepID=A0AA86PZN4_9EUKA|nr:Cation-transporting ATPase [Hexamita inflata]
MVTETTTKVTLLRPKKLISFYMFVILSLYVSYFVMMKQLGDKTYAAFLKEPEDMQVLKHFEYEIEDAQLYNYTLSPISTTKDNVLGRWSKGNGAYQGLKLTLLFPVTFHMCYILFKHWSAAFKAKVCYKKTKDPLKAHFVQLNVTHKTGLVHEANKVYLCKVHHYYTNKKYQQQIEFENEKYNLIEANGEYQISKHFKSTNEVLPQIINISEGLSRGQHYQQLTSFGENRIVLKYPVYMQILLDELLSPYFAFQVFCSVLYALDNFATYSLFSLVFLFFTEGANVYTKYNSLKSTCKLAPKPIKINVLRDNEVKEVSSASLVPGDIVIYKKSDYDTIAENTVEEKEKPKNNFMNPQQQIMNMAVFKIIFRIKELVFGKYYDEKIYKDLNKTVRSDIFPVDMILIEGQLIADESILTGEQASQIKEKIDELTPENIQQFNEVFSGTKLIQIQSEQCKLLVIKTASQTEQGKLIKTIAFNEERMNITTKDSIFFLFIMFVVAVFSGVYAFRRGFKNEVCQLNKLFLECLMIFVSVIPPDLPTELSLCIGNAIREMRGKKVFSTEPYRILNAGRIKYICFDKSGTLTQSNIKIIGVDDKLTNESFKEISEKAESKKTIDIKCGEQSKIVIAGCQSLTRVKKEIIGDILEVNAFSAIGAELEDKTVIIGGQQMEIIKRFYFNSTIKRMSVIIKLGARYYLVTKGSPEAIQMLLKTAPNNYKLIVSEYTKKGLRVLGLALKEITVNDIDKSREELENQLSFTGLLICQTPLKKDTANSIEILKKSDHQLKVISGDHVLNVAVSAQQCGIIERKEDIIIVDEIKDTMVKYYNLKQTETIIETTVSDLIKMPAAICLTNSNNALSLAIKDPQYNELFITTKIFARTTPDQKAQIVQKFQLQNSESRTMFVGDGVNDLNALQAADIGVALLEEVEFVKEAKKQEQQIPYPSIMQQPGNQPAGYMQIVNEAQRRAAQKRTNPQYEMQVLMREQQIYKQYLKMNKLNNLNNKNDMLTMWVEALDTEEETADMKMGDATIAAQFTVKSGSLVGVLDIIRQGRCALATVQMNFKTTALECLVGAYSMTAMTLNGVRSSEYQLIASSLLQTAIVMYISKAKQQTQISATKPPKTIAGSYLIFSMFAQALVHIGCLYFVQLLAGSQLQTFDFGYKFQPSLVNTCVFFMRMFLDSCVTLVNYPGKPHMESIFEHKKLLMSVGAYLVGMFVLLFEVAPELNQMLGFVQIADDLKLKLVVIGAADFGLCWAFEQIAKKIFG